MTHPARKYARAMGYVRGLRRLYARGRRCRPAWAPHVQRSRALILEAAQLCSRHLRVLVVGSGPLFDVPVAQLSRRFEEVVLADIVHLGRVRVKIRQFSNVSLATVDVTGMAEAVYDWARKDHRSAPPDRMPNAFLEEDFDLVVSCNVLSQLPLSVVRYATRVRGQEALGDSVAFSQRMVIRHLDWLVSFGGNVCLITDTHQRHRSDGKIECDSDILWGVALPPGARPWLWDLAPRPEVSQSYDVQHRVVGYACFPKETWMKRQALDPATPD